MATQEDIDRIVKEEGWGTSKTNGGHLKYEGPDGQVVFGPSTPSDHRSIDNLASQLRRAGVPIPHAGGHRPKPRTGVAVVLRDYLRNNPTKVVTAAHLLMIAKAHCGSDISPASASSFLNSAKLRGEVRQLSRLEWQWAGGRAEEVPAPLRQELMPIEVAPAPVILSTLVSDEAQVADDKEILDEALAALGRIETVLARTKKKIDQLEALRKLLGGT